MLITVEGGDGAGKTTLVRALADRWSAAGLPVRTTLEPGGTELGRGLRELVLRSESELSAWAETFLFLADRAADVAEIIRPALERGESSSATASPIRPSPTRATDAASISICCAASTPRRPAGSNPTSPCSSTSRPSSASRADARMAAIASPTPRSPSIAASTTASARSPPRRPPASSFSMRRCRRRLCSSEQSWRPNHVCGRAGWS